MKLSGIAIALLLIAGCSQKPSAQSDSSSSTAIAPSVKPSTTAVQATFTPKELPTLGTDQQQIGDHGEVLKAAMAGDLSKIPKTSSAGVTPNPIAVLEGYPPQGTDVCNLPYSALTSAIYERCLKEGMTYAEVASIIGFEGKQQASSGNSVTYNWSGSGGSMSAVFTDGKMVSKAQQGLK
jgi:hypothetical protein